MISAPIPALQGKSKRCVACKSLQPLYRFERHDIFPDGLSARCVDCLQDYRHDRRHLRQSTPATPLRRRDYE